MKSNREASGTRLYTAGLIVLKDKRLLLAFSKNKQAWYLPGGKLEAGESAAEALVREIKEELQIALNPADLHYYCHISAPAHGEANHIIMEQSCYCYDLKEPVYPSGEISKLSYFTAEAYLLEPIRVAGVSKVFEKLAADHII